jgi:isoleucyl-tRNA synthetase
VLYVADAKDAALFDGLDLGEIAITSNALVSTHEPPADAFRLPDVAGAAVEFHHAEGNKCERCWRILPEVGTSPAHDDLCNRCGEAVDGL